MDNSLLALKLKYNSEYVMNIDKKVIYIFGELNEEIGTQLRLKYDILTQWYKDVNNEKIENITLDISSYGGNIHAITSALDFYDEVLREDGVIVNTKAQGVCMSAATILLAGGTGERTATKRCKIMLHDIQVDGMGGTAKQLQSAINDLINDQIELFSFYAMFSNRGENKLEGKELIKEAQKWLKKFTKDGIDHYITSQDALSLRLIDKVL